MKAWQVEGWAITLSREGTLTSLYSFLKQFSLQFPLQSVEILRLPQNYLTNWQKLLVKVVDE